MTCNLRTLKFNALCGGIVEKKRLGTLVFKGFMANNAEAN
jgi:hypothetical protein